MKEAEISLAEMFRVTCDSLPIGWDLAVTVNKFGASFSLEDIYGEDREVPYEDERETSETLLAYVNYARKETGMKPVGWDGEEIDA